MRTRAILKRGLNVIAAARPQIVLDLGCGTGHDTQILSHLPNVKVIGIDWDHDALTIAPTRPNVYYLRADVTRLPLTTRTVGGSYSFGLLQVLSQGGDAPVRNFLRELARVLRLDAPAIIGTLADFRRQTGPERSLTGAEVSKAMRGLLVLRELIGTMDAEDDERQTRYWYIHAIPMSNTEV